VLLSASHSMRISTPTTSISGPDLHVDGNELLLKNAFLTLRIKRFVIQGL